MGTVRIRVKRYQPEGGAKSYYQEYEVPYTRGMVVLDALNYIKDNMDGSLTYRWSCRMGICGSCGALVNGVPRLTCATFLSSLRQPVTVEPLNNFPVIKDLVVNIDDFMEKLVRIQPWIVRERERPIEEGEYRQTPEEMERYHQFSLCINCGLCYAACPVYAADKGFIGPAAAALGYRYYLDSRDEGGSRRLEILTEGAGAYDCTFVGECSAVCPKGVDPALALQRIKLESAMNILSGLLPRRVVGRPK
jgi:fumarate reductase iron-sulfur subunit